MVVIVMGVSGSGKSTVGRLLAGDLGWAFYDADALHPAENVDKMSAGHPLTDADREPWLRALRTLVEELLRSGQNAVLACSALKAAYRKMLLVEHPQVQIVFLDGSLDMVRRRLERRRGHFFKTELLESQFADLEKPEEAITVSIEQSPMEMAAEIRRRLERLGVTT